MRNTEHFSIALFVAAMV